MVGVLSAIENTIEWITGDSADFRNGKMITMTREERQERRMREIEKQRQARERKRSGQATSVADGPPSVYRLPLPLPGSPGEEHITPLTQVIEEEKEKKAPSLERAGRGGATLITSGDAEDTAQRLPRRRQFGLSAPDDDGEEEAGDEGI
jgi:hypothetical protein